MATMSTDSLRPVHRPLDLDESPRSFHEEETTTIREEDPQNKSSNHTVQDLFGPSVGPSCGDFSCTHSRIRGRLYATRQAALFYTNWLGFERRFCLLYREMDEMELFRSTSIRITMKDDETYVFKSLDDRERVLDLLKGLKQGLLHEAILPMPPPPVVSEANRQRSVSDSFVRDPSSAAAVDVQTWLGNHRTTATLRRNEPTLRRNEPTLRRDSIREEPTTGDPPPLEESGLEEVTVDCSLDYFYTHFLADKAPYGWDVFQRTVIGDRDVQLTPWHPQSNQQRTLSFVHPLQSWGGPSEAKTRRQQTLKRHNKGMVLESRTTVEGIPGADAFAVYDRWHVKVVATDQIALSSRFEVRFTKRSLFKGLIQKSVKTETKASMRKYAEFVRNKVTPTSSRAVVEQERGGRENELTQMDRLSRNVVVLQVMVGLLLVLQLVSLVLWWSRVGEPRSSSCPAEWNDAIGTAAASRPIEWLVVDEE